MDLEHPEITQIRKTGYPTRQLANNNQEYVDYSTREDEEQMDLNETLDAVVSLGDMVNEAYKKGFIGFMRTSHGEPIVQMSDESFKEYMDAREVEVSRNEEAEHPFELSFEHEGVRFFTIMKEKEYEDFFKEEE